MTEPTESKFHIRLLIHTASREEFRIDLGEATETQLTDVNELCSRALNNQPIVKDWIITDVKKRTYHFNVEHIVCIVVES